MPNQLPCNCGNRCLYNHQGECRRRMVVYRIKCRQTGKYYIGATQRFMKTRGKEHCDAAVSRVKWKQGKYKVRSLSDQNRVSGSFARHWGQTCPAPPHSLPSPGMIRDSCTWDNIWCGDAIQTSKCFGTWDCGLCQAEKVAIIKASWQDPDNLMNTCREIYGTCRHNAKLHKLL